MENRSLAIKYLSEAVNLDSSGLQEVAFAKYLQSLQVLTVYLNDMFNSLGFLKMLEKNSEVKQVLSMVRECSDRVSLIINSDKSNATRFVNHKVQASPQVEKVPPQVQEKDVFLDYSNTSKSNFPAFQEMQSENMKLLRRYQWRSERLKDERAKINLRLELERQMIENSVIAKNKYNATVKQMQTERIQLMEKERRKLLQKGQLLTQKQKERQELYLTALEYTKTEIWPCTWLLNSVDASTLEVTKLIFQKTIRCNEHPLSQWLLVSQTNIKREIDQKFKLSSDYRTVPDILSTRSDIAFEENSSVFIIHFSEGKKLTMSKSEINSLGIFIKNISADITYTIENVLQVFYLIYESLLPEDSEEICHRLIETHFLEPIWKNYLLLYRISNVLPESKIMPTILSFKHQNEHSNEEPSPSIFGFSSKEPYDPEIYTDCLVMLQDLPKSQSMSEKLHILVEVCQTICGTPSNQKATKRRLGADELIPLLCFIIVRSGMVDLCSECYAIEQLFDMKYMFGEEGYSLSSFLTALKYLEITKV